MSILQFAQLMPSVASGPPATIIHRQATSPVTYVDTYSLASAPVSYAAVSDGNSCSNIGGINRMGYFDFGSSKYIESVRALNFGLQDYGTGTFGQLVYFSIRGSNDAVTWTNLWSSGAAAGNSLVIPVNSYYRYIDFGPYNYAGYDGYTYVDCIEVVGEA